MKKLIFFIIPIISACAATQKETGPIDYGAYPENHEEIIKGHMQRRLKDPYSAVYTRLSGPGRFNYGVLNKQYGYAVCMSVNAKNAFGGYTGAKPYFFLMRNGVVTATQGGADDIAIAFANGLCEKVVSEDPTAPSVDNSNRTYDKPQSPLEKESKEMSKMLENIRGYSQQ